MKNFHTQHSLLKPLIVALWLVAINRYFLLCLETNGTNEYYSRAVLLLPSLHRASPLHVFQN